VHGKEEGFGGKSRKKEPLEKLNMNGKITLKEAYVIV
jgi:hypothetical protein